MQRRGHRLSGNERGIAFAERAKASRLRAGLTQQQLSDRLQHEANVSLDTSAITRIEAGQREPRLGEALAIAKVLEFGLDDLAPRSDLDSYLSDVHLLMHESRAALVKALRSVDPVVDFVRQNPDCLGDDNLEELLTQVIERFQQRTSPENFESAGLQAADFAITTNRNDERLKRQVLRAVSDGILVRADELQPAYDRWFNEDRRASRKTSPTTKAGRGRQSAHSRSNAEQ
ncbi:MULTISPECIES: helix-turn-helix transcriptional regulator [unclassified Mycobacterium]|uniref:helix-turn-helix transcriptional regulator n=1 Tax=unclassified Mycobacterium TaxID=2642494 RepID=UPI0018D2FA36|nr:MULTISPECIES: helix-turn-helix transcriptional regulator [unclassified Mycobacterium]